MTAAREQILSGIRSSLKRGRLDPGREAELRARVTAHGRNLIPARASALDHRARIDLFVAMAEEVQATVAPVNSFAAVPEAVARYLAEEKPGRSSARNAARFFSTETRPTLTKIGRGRSIAAARSGRKRSVSTPRVHIARCAKPRLPSSSINERVDTIVTAAASWKRRNSA